MASMLNPNNENFGIVIVGAGVLGISLAYHLSKRGRSCLLIEKESLPCTHASAKNAGMIRQLYRNEQLTEWAERSISSWDSHITSTYFKQTGSIVLRRESPVHHRHLFKNITINLQGKEVNAVFTKSDGLLESESYVQYLKKCALSTSHVEIETNTKITSITKLANNNWELLSEDNKVIECELLVNAAGAWMNSFLEDDHKLPAKSYVRHLFLSQGWDAVSTASLPHHGFYWDELNSWYRRNWGNKMLVSACDANACDPEMYVSNTEVAYYMADKIVSQYPDQAKEIKIGKGWHCFRTYTQDQLPILGFDHRCNNLYWLAAFGGFGMSTSFAATEDAALEIINGKATNSKFSPSRFQD